MNEKEFILEKILLDNLYCRSWCARNEIDYCNPDVQRAREIVYENYKPREVQNETEKEKD